MTDRSERHHRPIMGLLSLLSATAGFVCWFLNFSPGIFLFGVVGLQVLSAILAVLAGWRNSRRWFAATLLPVFMIVFMVPQYEQRAEISLKGIEDGKLVFGLSGTFTVPSFTISVYSMDVERPADPRFLVWRIEAADQKDFGMEAWRIGSIRYAVVPQGYIQTFPEKGSAVTLKSGTIYGASAGGSFNRYVEIVNNTPRWVDDLPEEPCFTRENNRWVKISRHPDTTNPANK